MKKIEIKTNDNFKIKDFILKYIKYSTASAIEKHIKKGNIKVNNKKVIYSYILQRGDVIKLFVSFKMKKYDYSFLESKKEIDVFYEDENILIINKEAGILSQQDKTEKTEYLNNHLKKYLFLKKEWTPECSNGFNPNLCHRLDKETSGLIVAAKNLKTSREINEALANSTVVKKYIALVYGKIPKGKKRIESFIFKNEITQKMEIDEEKKFNKKIVTEYELIESFKNFSKIKVQIYTGKKHQIRVQMTAIGHPVLGDKKYNKIDSFNFKNLCLQSNEIKFNFSSKSFLYYLNNKSFIAKEPLFT